MLYGFPYMGSKTKIAKEIMERLPSGNRFVDLCGGGAAMTHCALLSGKYDSVLYNDLDPMPCRLLKDAIAGKYNYECFKPEFITREMFYERKDTDAYVKYIWSFGNAGQYYLYGKDREPIKHKAYDFVVFGIWDDEIDAYVPGVKDVVTAQDIHTRRRQFSGYARKMYKEMGFMEQQEYMSMKELEQLERLERMEQLERLERMEQLERLERMEQLEHCIRIQDIEGCERIQQLSFFTPPDLEITNISLYDYEYRNGDVVYIDPPYQGKHGYTQDFDNARFLDWAASRPYTVYISETAELDKRFEQIWSKGTTTPYCATRNTTPKTERLYRNPLLKRC